jgi:HSP20 family protein
MNHLARWNPFKPSVRFDPVSTFDDLFRGLGVRPIMRDFEMAPEIRIDVSEDANCYHVKAEVPGVEKKDLEISVDRNKISIGAEVRREESRKDEKSVYSERYFGKVFRSFELPGDIDSTKADAHYENGVLSLILPKKSNGGSRRIEIAG